MTFSPPIWLSRHILRWNSSQQQHSQSSNKMKELQRGCLAPHTSASNHKLDSSEHSEHGLLLQSKDCCWTEQAQETCISSNCKKRKVEKWNYPKNNFSEKKSQLLHKSNQAHVGQDFKCSKHWVHCAAAISMHFTCTEASVAVFSEGRLCSPHIPACSYWAAQ